MKRLHLWLALVLLIVVNAVVLTGVARNRSGTPDAATTLTERELVLDVASPREENSGLALLLDWRGEFVREWFDADKLTEVGFDVAAGDGGSPDHRRRELPIEAFVVLEYEGEAWDEHKRRQENELDELRLKFNRGVIGEEQAERELGRIEGDLIAGSRLFAVDAGVDSHALRSRYPDGGRYIIAPALVRLSYRWEEKPSILQGTVESILVDRLHVPRDLAGKLLALPQEGRLQRGYTYYKPEEKSPAPRYEIQVCWGQRYESWVAGVGIFEQ
jgi:hypothetical protein